MKDEEKNGLKTDPVCRMMGREEDAVTAECDGSPEKKNDFNERLVLSKLDISLPRPATSGGQLLTPMARRRP